MQRNALWLCKICLSSCFSWNNLLSDFHMHFLSVLPFYAFVSFLSVSPLWRSKTQNSGSSACSRYSSQQRWLLPDQTRERNKPLHCIRDLQKPLKNLCFEEQGATTANFLQCYQKPFVSITFFDLIHADFCRWSRNILPKFNFFFASLCNSNGLSQFGISQYNSVSVQFWFKFQSGNGFMRKVTLLSLV